VSTERSRGFPAALVIGLCAALVPPGEADAGNTSTTMAVSATVLSYCSVSTLPLAFGNYSGSAVSASTTVTVTCTLGTAFNLGIDAGLGSGATVAARKMTYGANTLTYGLYSNAGATTVLGSTIGTNTVADTGTGTAQTVTVYGQIPAGQAVAPGTYSDTVTVTITY